MKFQLMGVLLLIGVSLAAQQNKFNNRDTLLRANAEGNMFFSDIPTGNDDIWVNYDEDGLKPACSNEDNPYGWYLAQDEGQPSDTPDSLLNYTFTSCSYMETTGNMVDPCSTKNRDWLISPAVHIAGLNPTLTWKSSSRNGPMFVDGYKVLISTTDNFTYSFTDTVFVAAEMINSTNPPHYNSLDPGDYIYSPGYLHANAYTDTAYIFKHKDEQSGVYFLNGKLEPHSIDLTQYIGKTIYFAFLHDSQCDFLLQVDDILVSADSVLSTRTPPVVTSFGVMPNPSEGLVQVTADLSRPLATQLHLTDMLGRIVWLDNNSIQPVSSIKRSIDFSWLAPGVYNLVLKTEKGVSTRKFIKR
jgi:hypothetical protein